MAATVLRFTRTRLAPSPTGRLHLGHARTFLVTWWLARQAGAEIIMRMEDLDPGRAKTEAVAQAYEDLRWLGMDWDNDEVPMANGESGAYVQSERAAAGVYADVIERLWQANKVFPCTCTRADLLAAVTAGASAPHEGEGQPRYLGTCRISMEANPCVQVMANPSTDMAPEERRRAVTTWRPPAKDAAQLKVAGKPFCWRFEVEPGLTRFEDVILGPQAFDVSAQIGDFPLTRFDGTPAYQLAVVADDAAMKIDCVIRGDDLLSSTPRQLLIFEALGAPVPAYGHVPLVVGTDGKRLAKRHGESRIAQFRQHGVTPQRVIGWVAWRSGQTEKPEEMQAREMVGRFDLAQLPRDRVVLTDEDLTWLMGGKVDK